MTNQKDARSTELLSAALDYAARGWVVIPLYGIVNGVCECEKGKDCPAPGVHRRTDEATHAGSKDHRAIRKWWKQWPHANIGIATGKKNGIVAVCFDPVNGGLESLGRLSRANGRIPDDLFIDAGSGWFNLLFAHPRQTIRESSGEQGIDIRSEGKYVVAPPSMHVSGRRCEWKCGSSDFPMPELPPTWLDWIQVAPCYTSNSNTSNPNTINSSNSLDSSYSDSSERSEDKAAGQAGGFASLAEHVEKWLSTTIPSNFAEFHRMLFRFLRQLKLHPDLKCEHVRAIKPYVKQWHKKALDSPFQPIGTRPFVDTWDEAVYAWDRIDGREWITEQILDWELSEPLPNFIKDLEYADHTPTVRLVLLCRGLQRFHGDEPFFLSARTAGERIGTDAMTASRKLIMLQADGVIKLTKMGDYHSRQASEYLYTGDEIEEKLALPAGVGQ